MLFNDRANSIQHFVNEQIRDVVELLEDVPQSDLAIASHGELKKYTDGTLVFLWKTKEALVFRPEKTHRGIEYVVYQTLNHNHRVTLDDFNEVN